MFRSRLIPAIAAAVVLLVVGVGAWWWLRAPAPELAEAPVATSEPSDEAAPSVGETPSAPAVAQQEPADPSREQAAEAPAPQPQEQVSALEQQPGGSEETTTAPEQADSMAATPGPGSAAVPEPGQAEEQEAATATQNAASEDQVAAQDPEPPAPAEASPEEGTEVAELTVGLECPPEPEAPGCALAAKALGSIGGSAAGSPELMLNQPDGIYLDQEYLVVEAEMPAELGGYLYLDVLTDAGQVFHLLPEPMREDNELPAGGDIRVGVEEAERAAGVRHWQVGGPFSDGYLLATVSEKPLYDGLRPLEEPVADYREILLQSLADPDTGRKAARVERLEFRPRQ